MGDHRLESLLGRALNQAVSGIMIDAAGFHDEALSLVRNIGEIANLFALFLLNPHSFDDWSGLEEKCRKKRFSAVHVRIAIEKQGKIAVPMDEQTYGRLSEQFVHIGSSTVPNAHDVDGLGHIGGKVQNNGTAEFQKELTYIVTHIALSASSLFKRQDFRSQLADLVILERATN